MLSEPYLNTVKTSREKSENMELIFCHAAVAVLCPQRHKVRIQSQMFEPSIVIAFSWASQGNCMAAETYHCQIQLWVSWRLLVYIYIP